MEYEKLKWRFEMVGEVVERSWVGWVLRRMRMAMDDKVRCADISYRALTQGSDIIITL